jgi:DNA-binding SARP family transcriptional activator
MDTAEVRRKAIPPMAAGSSTATGTHMEIRLLGPIEVWDDDRPLEVGGARQRAVLAALAVDAGRSLPIETIIDRVWDGRPPPQARHTLHAYVTRLRKLFGDDDVRLVCRGGAYTLMAGPSRLDATRLTAPLGTNDAAGIRQALALWRGEPLAGLDGLWATAVRDRLTRTRLLLAFELARLDLRRGDPDAVVRDLTPLADEYPGSEQLTGTLMAALHDAGNSSEALRCYAALRRHLAGELGCEPGPRLRRLHLEILRGGNPAALPFSR